MCVWKPCILIASIAYGICCVKKSCILIASVSCGIVIMHSHWMSALLLQQVAGFFVSLHSNWLSGLEKKEASIVEMASNSFVISEINLYQSYLKASI